MALSNAPNPRASLHHYLVAAEITLVVLALPLSIWAAHNTVSYNPRASGPDTPTGSRQPATLQNHFAGNTINCHLGEPCTATFNGTGQREDDRLNLEINFLPPGLRQNTCQTQSSPNLSSITCSFSGTPSRTGEFKLLVALKNQAGDLAQNTVNLNIR